MRMKKLVRFIFGLLIACTFTSWVFAQNTGKIAGTVKDSETGEPLIGANVIVEGTDLGAASNENGKFHILQVPPGEYRIVCNYIGYHKLTVSGVEVRPDLTTTIPIELTPEALEAEAVEVVAERNMVQADMTSTRESISSEEVESMPGIESVEDIFRAQAGMIIEDQPEQIQLGNNVNMEVRDPSLRGISVRGFSGSDPLIMIDGIPVSHPVSGGFDLMNLNVEDIQDVEIIKGAFSAQYGNTQSAIINIITKSGGSQWKGGVNYRTDVPGIWGDSYGKHRVAVNMSGAEPLTGQLLPSIGLDLPGDMTYYLSATLDMSNTPYNNHRDRDALFVLPSYLGGSQNTLVKERQRNKGNTNFKLSYDITSNVKTVFSYRNSWRRWSRYKRSWASHPNHMADYKRDNSTYAIKLNHSLSSKTYYNLNFSYLSEAYTHDYQNRTPQDWWVMTPDTMYSMGATVSRDPLTGFFDANSYETPWRLERNSTASLRFDFTSQVTTNHMMKFGFNADYKDLYNVHLIGGAQSLSRYGQYLYGDGEEYPPPPGPYKAFGQRRWIINGNPISGSLYLSDKVEYESLVINAGLRFDWLRPGPPTTDDEWKQQWERATGLQADWPAIHYQLDPRLGVSFPISTKTGIYFSYGQFNKHPSIADYIRDPYSGGFTGNPHLDFKRTVKYEFGFSHEFPRKWAMDIKNFTNESSGSVGSTRLRAEYGLPIDLMDNKGYSRARGLELTVRKQRTEYLRGRLTYTLQWAKGYSSSKFYDYRRSQNNFPEPIRERRLGWDRRHQLVMNFSFNVGPNQEVNLFGFTLPRNWNASVLSIFKSGRPYTPGTNSASERRRLHHSKTMPPDYRTDVRFEKVVQFKNFRMTLGFNIDNIFNNYNPQSSAFNEWTGEPYKYGDTIEDSNQMYDYYRVFRMLSPDRFGEGRHVTLEIKVSL